MLERHYRHWTPQEDAELIAGAGARRLTTTAAHLGRTVDAARRRAVHILHLDHAQEARRVAGMSLADVCRALGVGPEYVRRWQRKGWLATHTGYGIAAGHTSIDPYDLSAFLAERGALLPYLRPTDLAWREEIADARAALLLRYIESPALRTILHWSRGTRTYVKRWHGFGNVTTLSLGTKYPLWYERASVRAWLDQHPQYWTQEAKERL